MTFEVKTDITQSLAEQLAKASTQAEHIVAIQVEKDTRPYVPMRTGSLNQRTRVVGNSVIYPAPYSRYLYYGKVMVDSATGKGAFHFVDKQGNEFFRFRKGAKLMPTERNLVFTTDFHPDAQAYWFEASKAQNLDKWLRVAQKAVTHFGK